MTAKTISGPCPIEPRGIKMKRRLSATMLIASLAALPMMAAPAGQASAQSASAPDRYINLSIGRGELITVPGSMANVFVANDTVADVQVKSDRQLYLFGKAGGVTTVYASNKAGAVIWSANVRVGSNIDSVDQMLTMAMPDAHVSVATMGVNTFLLTGTVAAPEDSAEAERLVQAFVGKEATVISRLRTATPLQVNLQVRIAEVNRSLVRELNANLSTADYTDGFKIGIGSGRALGGTGTYNVNGPIAVGTGVANPSIKLPDGTSIVGPAIQTGASAVSTIGTMGKLFGLNFLGALDVAERIGLVTTLSQPNLTALSGETADFLAGGEFPIPISQGLGSTSIEYKKYGVSLSYTPTVLANGRISMRVRPEVSELSTQGSVQLNGFTVPAITTRRAETTIELGSGQSFMIAGLLSNSTQNNIDKTPGLGDIPVLGNMFRSTSYRKGETELVIVVTPYLVNPVNANDIRLPTDGYNAPNEIQRLVGMHENAGVTGGDRPKPSVAQDLAQPAVPAISQDDAAAAAMRARFGMPESKKKKPSRSDRRASADAAPGFSFN